MKLRDHNLRNILNGHEMVQLFRFMADVHHDSNWRDKIDLSRFAVEAGCRVSEMLEIYLDYRTDKSCLNIYDNEIWLDLKKTKNHEDGRVFIISKRLDPFLRSRIARLKSQGQSILFPDPTGQPYTRWTFGRWWQDVLKSAGIPRERRKFLSIHKARHTFASWALATQEYGFETMESIRAVLGHCNFNDTRRYSRAGVILRMTLRDQPEPAWWVEAVRPLERNLRIAK